MMNEDTRAGRFTGLALAMLATVMFCFWWAFNDVRPNALSFGIGGALVALITVHAVLLATRAQSSVVAPLVATGLWIFAAVAVGGLLLAATAAGDDDLRPTPLNLRMVSVAAFIAAYAVLVVAVRYWWIVRPVAQLVDEVTTPVEGETDGDVPGAGLWASAYFIRERRAALARRLEGVDAEDTVRLAVEATSAYAVARGDTRLADSWKALEGALSGAPGAAISPARMAFHTRAILLDLHDRRMASALYLWKVQNQLFVCVVILLGAVAFFGIQGWGAPMSVAAVAAVVVRVRSLAPLGDPGKYDGGARWMTLFMTPLVGAVSAVIGLALISALSALKLFNEDLPEVIGLSSGVWVGAEAPAFGVLALGFAAAFGWSARMLDTMLAALTARVAKEAEAEADGHAAGAGGAGGSGGGGSGTGGSDDTADEVVAADEAVAESESEGGAASTGGGRDPKISETPETLSGSNGSRGTPEDRAGRLSRVRGARRARGLR